MTTLSTTQTNTFNWTGQIETVTVGTTGWYDVTALGAQGGNANGFAGGFGAMATGVLFLQAGAELEIVVGGVGGYGGNPGWGGGGGGGSFVILTANPNPLATPIDEVIAGGGGGAARSSGGGGLAGPTGGGGSGDGGAGGVNGAPGQGGKNSFGNGAGGGGFAGGAGGKPGQSGSDAGTSFAGGAVGTGGQGGGGQAGAGGFGGGGGGVGGAGVTGGGGGGGGYGGGGGGSTNGFGFGGGGGGGSFVNSNLTVVSGTASTAGGVNNNGNGLVTIEYEQLLAGTTTLGAGDEGGIKATTLSATFSDFNTADTASDFTGTISWGDGQTTSFDGSSISGGNGDFTISGFSHAYAEAGTYGVSIAINDAVGGATQTDTGTASVADVILFQGTATLSAGFEGGPAVPLIATFTDLNQEAVPQDFTATIDWGDGTTEMAAGGIVVFPPYPVTGTITGSGGSYSVNDSHAYANDGLYTVTVTINDKGGATTTDTGVVSIAGSPLTAGTATLTGGVEGTTATTLSATFSDANTSAPTTDFSGTIAWGDGTTTNFTSAAVTGSNGTYTVSGSYQYAEAGAYTASVTINDIGNSTSDTSNTVIVTDAPLTKGIVTLNGGVEGTTATSLAATFTDANTAAPTTDFSGTIVWGDGQTTNFDSSSVSGSNGSYTVSGSHQYAEEGSYTANVTINDAGGSTTTESSSAVTVTDAPLTAGTATLTGGVEFVTATTLSATFSDANTAAPTTDFSGTIAWGDGQTTTFVSGDGTVSGNNGTYTVSGSHQYTEDGTYNLSVVINDVGGDTTTVTGTATVADAPLTKGIVTLNGGVEETTATSLAATFSDANLSAPASDFSGTIAWGDGTITSFTSAAVSGSGGNFTVSGSHTYAEGGNHTATVTINDDGGQSTTDTGSTTVADAPLNATGLAIAGTEGAALTATVATFTDANLNARLSDFTASINWGDGKTSSGTVVVQPGGGFAVTGTHTYATSASYATSVSINDDDGSTAQANGAAEVGTPPAAATHHGTVAEGASTGTLAAGDSDPDGDSVTVTAVDGSAGNVGNAVTGTYGTLTLNADDTFSYSANNTAAINAAAAGTDPTDTFTYTVSDGEGGSTVEALAIAVTRPPTIAGTVANQSTTWEAPVQPFSDVTIGDPNAGATDTLTITLSSTGAKLGALSGAGLAGSGSTYQLSGSAATITSELDALSFTAVNGEPFSSVTTTFTLSDQSSAFAAPATDNTTSVIDTDSAIPPLPLPELPNRNLEEWILQNGKFAAGAAPGSIPGDLQVAAIGDFTGNGTDDILWHSPSTGDVAEWIMSNAAWDGSVDFGKAPAGLQIEGAGNFFGSNAPSGVLWLNPTTGEVDIWEMSNGHWAATVDVGNLPGTGWQAAAIGDFTGNGTDDILWHNTNTGDVAESLIQNGQWAGSVDFGTEPAGLQIEGAGHFFGSSAPSGVLWLNPMTSEVDIWEMSNGHWAATVDVGNLPGTGWQVAGIGDFTGNGTDDILWHNTNTGDFAESLIQNGHWAGSVDFGNVPGWNVAGIGHFINADNAANILWHTT